MLAERIECWLLRTLQLADRMLNEHFCERPGLRSMVRVRDMKTTQLEELSQKWLALRPKIPGARKAKAFLNSKGNSVRSSGSA